MDLKLAASSELPAAALNLPYIGAVLDTAANLTERRIGDSMLPRVSIQGPNEALARMLAGATGVKVTPIERSFERSPCSIHCDAPHVHVRSRSFRWSLTGAKATVVLAATLPYVVLRHDEFEVAVERGLRAPIKPATAEKMRGLGWPIPAWVRAID